MENAAFCALHEALTERVRRHSREPGWDRCTGLPVPEGGREGCARESLCWESRCGMAVLRGWGAIPSRMGSPTAPEKLGQNLLCAQHLQGWRGYSGAKEHSLAALVLPGKSSPTCAGDQYEVRNKPTKNLPECQTSPRPGELICNNS